MKITVIEKDNESGECLNKVKSVYQKKDKFEIEHFDGEIKIYNNDKYRISYLVDN